MLNILTGYGIKNIKFSESSYFFGDMNLITINFTIVQNVSASSEIEIYGLNRTQTPDGPVKVENLDSTISGSTDLIGEWDGWTLKINVTTQALTGTVISLRFQLLNAQSPGRITPIIVVAKSNGTIISTMYGSAIQLGSEYPLFTTALISESSPIVLARNTLVVELVPNFRLPFGSTITISGLTLVRDPTGSKALGGPSAQLFEGSSGAGFADWSQDTGSLRFSVAIPIWSPGQACTFSFNLTNQSGVQDAAAASVTAVAAFDTYQVLHAPQEPLRTVVRRAAGSLRADRPGCPGRLQGGSSRRRRARHRPPRQRPDRLRLLRRRRRGRRC